jgi:hypothetical protein
MKSLRRSTVVMVINHVEMIMEGFDCDFNTAMQLYQRGTSWEN